MMNEYTFEVNGGAVTDERGKQHWPDVLTVWMPRWWAWQLLHQLVNQLEEGKTRVEFQFANCGKMTIEEGEYDLDAPDKEEQTDV